MKKSTLTKWVFAVSAAALVTAGSVKAGTVTASKEVVNVIVEEETSWWSADLAAGWDNKYVFRGVNILGGTNGLIWTDLSFAAYGFAAGAWYGSGVNEDYNELDLYASYTHALGPVSLEGGYIYYLYPDNDGEDTNEVFAKLSTDLIPYVTPTLAYYYDFDAIDGSYLSFQLTSSIPVCDMLSIDPFASISYSFDYNSDSNDLNDVELGVSVPVALSENITLSGYVKYVWALDAIDSFQGDEWVTGAAVRFSF